MKFEEAMDLPAHVEIRYYTSKDRRSYWEGMVIDTIRADFEVECKVWMSLRVVRGQDRDIPESQIKQWLPASALERLPKRKRKK